jgi:ABC-type glycerol-3-phosphate transport system substrate-binding protein
MKQLLITLLIYTLFSSSAITQTTITLKIAMPSWIAATYDAAYFDEFRLQNDGVEIVIISDNNVFPPPSPVWSSPAQYFELLEDYVNRADILYLSGDAISPESTRGGYWLDLAPLFTADEELDNDSYYSIALDAFRLDGGLWGLPVTIEPQIFGYLPTEFDAKGISYPSPSWTMEEFAEAAISLTEFDETHNPTKIGFFGDIRFVLRSLLGSNIYDNTTDPNIPHIDNPELAKLLDVWVPVVEEITPLDGYSSENVGMQIGGLLLFSDAMQDMNNSPLTPSLLPGGYSGAKVNGFSISTGTSSPELAYKLVKYISMKPRRVYLSSGEITANREVTISEGEMGVPPIKLSSETQSGIDQAMQVMLSEADLRYFDYVYYAMNLMQEQNIDGMTALQQMQLQALANLEIASAQYNNNALSVATSPQLSLEVGEIELNFGIAAPIADTQTWERVAEDFASIDNDVGRIILNQQSTSDYDQFVKNNDCFYLSYDAVDIYRQEYWLPLDPFFDADPAFLKSDFIPGIFQQFQIEGYTYTYPLTVQPVVLQYDLETLESLNIIPLNRYWTLSEFLVALDTIAAQNTAVPPLTIRTDQNTDLLMLIAAYGGLPVDFRTTPPTYNFTNPETVNAIQQVLNLAKSNIIPYSRLGTFTFSPSEETGVISTHIFTGYDREMNSKFGIALYPQGNQYTVLGFGDSGGGYISVNASNPDACYRWLKTIARHPELFGLVMPAQISIINDPITVATQGSDVVNIYEQIISLAKSGAIVFPSAFSGSTISLENFVVNQWLNRAFDAYVFDEANLELELIQAQEFVDGYLQCIANTPTTNELASQSPAARECVAQVDPSLDAEWDAAADAIG